MMTGVVTPHHTLQFGKFADHAGQQIALAQARRAGRRPGVDADATGNDPRQLGHADALVPQTAQRLLVGDGLELFLIAGQRRLQIRVPEEFRIGEARTDHPFVTLANLARILAVDVRDADEMLGKPAR